MKIESIRTLHVAHGFFWNSEISELARNYAGKRVLLKDRRYRLRFFLPELVCPGSSDFELRAMTLALGERCAPVGEYTGAHAILYLTESGKLYGFCDCLIVCWGDDLHWKPTIKCLLEETESTLVTHIDVGDVGGV